MWVGSCVGGWFVLMICVGGWVVWVVGLCG